MQTGNIFIIIGLILLCGTIIYIPAKLLIEKFARRQIKIILHLSPNDRADPVFRREIIAWVKPEYVRLAHTLSFSFELNPKDNRVANITVLGIKQHIENIGGKVTDTGWWSMPQYDKVPPNFLTGLHLPTEEI